MSVSSDYYYYLSIIIVVNFRFFGRPVLFCQMDPSMFLASVGRSLVWRVVMLNNAIRPPPDFITFQNTPDTFLSDS